MSIVIACSLSILIIGVGLNALITGCDTDEVRDCAGVGCCICLAAIATFTAELKRVLYDNCQFIIYI